ncbi:MAG: NAD(P)H-hydrate epimerase [Bacillota bacterium]
MIRLNRQQVREIDRRSIEDYHIPGIVLMENASRAVADVAEAMLRQTNGHLAMVLCGGGNNGGDGLAAARHLHNRQFQVMIALCTDPTTYKGDALINWQIAQTMGLPHLAATPQTIEQTPADLLIDAVFGTGLSRPPRPPFDSLVQAVTKKNRPVLAVDLPSGLDCDTGQPLGPCIRAEQTVTFVAEKLGFANPSSLPYTGPITVGDIGCPRELIEMVLQSQSNGT